jgi:hypothetical protein
MSYATIDYYKNTFYGASASDAMIEKYLSRASDDIDANALYSFTFEELPALFQELVKKACCAQAENYISNGEDEGGYSSLTVGSFAVSLSVDAKKSGILCGRAIQYLATTGLANRCIGMVRQ